MQLALGKENLERITNQIRFYEYYDGKQHVDPNTGQLVRTEDLTRPDGLDYDPTRYTTNYFKVFIQRKSRWQMGGDHTVHVVDKQIDSIEDAALPDYQPSEAQTQMNVITRGYEAILRQLWKENRMREKLLQASRDRLIAGRVVCKIMFNPRNGKLTWAFRPDYEYIPVYSQDDFEEHLGGIFVHQFEENGQTLYQIQKFMLDELSGECFLSEGVYNDSLQLVREITQRQSMGIDFLPIVEFSVHDISGKISNQEAEDLKSQTDILNGMNEDAIDSLKFEMFGMTAFLNVPTKVANEVEIRPGAVLVVSGTGGDKANAPDVKRVENGFKWKEAFDQQYARIKSAIHEITSVPNIVPQELNFGGLNGEAMQLLFHTIISETKEHWITWESRLQELHEKSVRYLQARTESKQFAYDKSIISKITDYTSEIKFMLPLPENRKDLVTLLVAETASGFESIAGAMKRLGVEDIRIKQDEIFNEKKRNMSLVDPYTEENNDTNFNNDADENG